MCLNLKKVRKTPSGQVHWNQHILDVFFAFGVFDVLDVFLGETLVHTEVAETWAKFCSTTRSESCSASFSRDSIPVALASFFPRKKRMGIMLLSISSQNRVSSTTHFENQVQFFATHNFRSFMDCTMCWVKVLPENVLLASPPMVISTVMPVAIS